MFTFWQGCALSVEVHDVARRGNCVGHKAQPCASVIINQRKTSVIINQRKTSIIINQDETISESLRRIKTYLTVLLFP